MSNMNIMAGTGVAVREYQLTTGEADCGLYIDGKVAGGIEAKKEGTTHTDVEKQTSGQLVSKLISYNSKLRAVRILCSHVKELARRLSIKPFHIDESQPQTLLRLWQAFGSAASGRRVYRRADAMAGRDQGPHCQ